MRPELVIPEDQCRLPREAKQRMRGGILSTNTIDRKSTASSSPVAAVSSSDGGSGGIGRAGGGLLAAETRELIARLLAADQRSLTPSDEALGQLSPFGRHKSEAFQHLAELTILQVQLIHEFIKQLPGYNKLIDEDKRTLQKACKTELLMLRTCRAYDPSDETVVLGNEHRSWRYDRELYRLAGLGAQADAVFDFAHGLAKLHLDDVELALLTAITVFCDRPGLIESKAVEEIQEVYTSALQSYLDLRRPKQKTIFARLIMKLTDLRSLGSDQSDNILVHLGTPTVVDLQLRH